METDAAVHIKEKRTIHSLQNSKKLQDGLGSQVRLLEYFRGILVSIITCQQGVKFYAPKESSFPISAQKNDVVKRTNTTLDVLQESQIDDFWGVDGDRELSWAVDRFHAVLKNCMTLSKEDTRGPGGD